MQRFTQAGRPTLHIRGGFFSQCCGKSGAAGWFPCVENARRRLAQINSITRLPEPVFCRGKPLFSFFLRLERHVYLNPK